MALNAISTEDYWLRWARIKKRQASQAESLANVASGMGEHGIANGLWQLEGLLLAQRAGHMSQAESAKRGGRDSDTQ